MVGALSLCGKRVNGLVVRDQRYAGWKKDSLWPMYSDLWPSICFFNMLIPKNVLLRSS